jgi:E3 ubiquitin-protein ligase RNF115/126
MNVRDNSNSRQYMTSMTKTYWCHLCKKEFNKIYIENTEVQCRYCQNVFCEEINSENLETDHPSNFLPYESSSNVNNILNTQRQRVRPRTTSSLLDFIINIISGTQEENNMENIINYIMQNDPNRYGNPPASKVSIDSLEKIKVTKENMNSIINSGKKEENSCSVCKDIFELEQNIINMPCKHPFHDECLLPWLSSRNSCPTCRYELSTEDEDYERRKRNNSNEFNC